MNAYHDEENRRYAVDVDGSTAGFAVYHLRGNRHYFVHTEVDDKVSGQGVGSALVRYALDDVRAQGGKVIPLCPFVAGYIDRHDEYADLVDQEFLATIDGMLP